MPPRCSRRIAEPPGVSRKRPDPLRRYVLNVPVLPATSPPPLLTNCPPRNCPGLPQKRPGPSMRRTCTLRGARRRPRLGPFNRRSTRGRFTAVPGVVSRVEIPMPMCPLTLFRHRRHRVPCTLPLPLRIPRCTPRSTPALCAAVRGTAEPWVLQLRPRPPSPSSAIPCLPHLCAYPVMRTLPRPL